MPANDRLGHKRGVYLGRPYRGPPYRPAEDDWDLEPLIYSEDRHGLVIGPTGTGKTSRWLMGNLLGDYLRDTSVVVTDPKGELAIVCALARINMGHKVKVLDPFGKVREIIKAHPELYASIGNHADIEFCGFDPLPGLDSASVNFYDDAAAIAEALVTIDQKDSHWTESATGLAAGLCMWEVLKAEREQRPPSLANVRAILTEPEVLSADGKPIGGLRAEVAKAILHAEEMAAARLAEPRIPDHSEDIVVSLLARFKETSREIDSIKSTLDTQTRWMLSKPMRDSLNRKPAIDFTGLKTLRDTKRRPTKPVSLFIILPAERMRTHAAWIRLTIVSCLRALYTPRGRRTVFLLDEMPAMGPLPPLADAFAIVRGFNLQIFGLAQDTVQMKALYGDRYESFLANCGVIQFLTPNENQTSGWIEKRAGTMTVEVQKSIGLSTDAKGEESDNSSRGLEGKPVARAQDLFSMKPGSGILFLAGDRDGIPFFVPSYQAIEQTNDRALPNPYYLSDAG